MEGKRIGVLGARGQTGQSILPMLESAGAQVLAFTRHIREDAGESSAVHWHGYQESPQLDGIVSTIPVWELPRSFDMMAGSGAGRIVVLSSTSVYTKKTSTDPEEQRLAALIENGEQALKTWAHKHDIDWVILRPTMIYGHGRDHNVSSLMRFVERFGFLPILGRGSGLRQPVHVDDVAQAAVAALGPAAPANRDYNLSGGETLSYNEMCRRLFTAMARRPRIIRVPLWLFNLMRPAAVLLPHRLRWLAVMMERMNRDLVFDHRDAARQLGYRPRPFGLAKQDLAFTSTRIIP